MGGMVWGVGCMSFVGRLCGVVSGVESGPPNRRE